MILLSTPLQCFKIIGPAFYWVWTKAMLRHLTGYFKVTLIELYNTVIIILYIIAVMVLCMAISYSYPYQYALLSLSLTLFRLSRFTFAVHNSDTMVRSMNSSDKYTLSWRMFYNNNPNHYLIVSMCF